MRNALLLSLLCTGFFGYEVARADRAVRDARTPATATAVAQKVTIPGTDYQVGFDPPARRAERASPTPELLRAIVTWLAGNFNLPVNHVYPKIERVAPTKIAVFRFTGILSDAAQDLARVPPGQREVVAAYDPMTYTIYLPLGWTGGNPAELSMLVHEMVHHLQVKAGIRYECPQAAEELAYLAQERWLGLFGCDLSSEFDIDAFSLLVSSRCFY